MGPLEVDGMYIWMMFSLASLTVIMMLWCSITKSPKEKKVGVESSDGDVVMDTFYTASIRSISSKREMIWKFSV